MELLLPSFPSLLLKHGATQPANEILTDDPSPIIRVDNLFTHCRHGFLFSLVDRIARTRCSSPRNGYIQFQESHARRWQDHPPDGRLRRHGPQRRHPARRQGREPRPRRPQRRPPRGPRDRMQGRGQEPRDPALQVHHRRHHPRELRRAPRRRGHRLERRPQPGHRLVRRRHRLHRLLDRDPLLRDPPQHGRQLLRHRRDGPRHPARVARPGRPRRGRAAPPGHDQQRRRLLHRRRLRALRLVQVRHPRPRRHPVPGAPAVPAERQGPRRLPGHHHQPRPGEREPHQAPDHPRAGGARPRAVARRGRHGGHQGPGEGGVLCHCRLAGPPDAVGLPGRLRAEQLARRHLHELGHLVGVGVHPARPAAAVPELRQEARPPGDLPEAQGELVRTGSVERGP